MCDDVGNDNGNNAAGTPTQATPATSRASSSTTAGASPPYTLIGQGHCWTAAGKRPPYRYTNGVGTEAACQVSPGCICCDPPVFLHLSAAPANACVSAGPIPASRQATARARAPTRRPQLPRPLTPPPPRSAHTHAVPPAVTCVAGGCGRVPGQVLGRGRLRSAQLSFFERRVHIVRRGHDGVDPGARRVDVPHRLRHERRLHSCQGGRVGLDVPGQGRAR